MKSGTIVERRDQVFTTVFWFFSFRFSTFLARWSSVNGPFLSDRPIFVSLCSSRALALLGLTRHDELVRPLVIAGLEATRRLTPRRDGMAPTGSLALAATVRVVDRVHGHAAIVRTATQPAAAAGFAERHIFVLHVSDLADRGHALDQHFAGFTRG